MHARRVFLASKRTADRSHANQSQGPDFRHNPPFHGSPRRDESRERVPSSYLRGSTHRRFDGVTVRRTVFSRADFSGFRGTRHPPLVYRMIFQELIALRSRDQVIFTRHSVSLFAVLDCIILYYWIICISDEIKMTTDIYKQC